MDERKECCSNGIVGYYVRFTLKKKSFSLSKRRDIEFAKGPRFDSAFEYTHTHAPSPFFFSCFVRVKRCERPRFFFSIFFHFLPKVHKKMSEL